MKYLVTGGAGFIGSHLVEKLLQANHEVVVVDDLSVGKLSNLTGIDECEIVIKKIQQVESERLSSIDGIFHLAAQASVPLSIEDFYTSCENNLLSTIKVFDIARKMAVPVVYATSSAVYGDLLLGDDASPLVDLGSPYAVDKLVSEYYASVAYKLYSVSSIGLRFFNIYGPRQDPSSPYSGVISIFSDRVSAGKPVTINGGYQTRDFVYVGDAANILKKAMERTQKESISEVVNVCTGRSITINDLLGTIVTLIGNKPKVIYKDLPPGDPEQSLGTYQNMLKLFGLQLEEFVPIEQGLEETVKYYKLGNK